MKRRAATLAAIVLCAGTFAMVLAQNAASGDGDSVIIKMTARKYAFEPSTIRVKKGAHVRLEVTALDREHGIKLDAFHIDKTLPKGEPVTVEFTADQAGTFPFECSRFCGLGHNKMKGQLVVE